MSDYEVTLVNDNSESLQCFGRRAAVNQETVYAP